MSQDSTSVSSLPSNKEFAYLNTERATAKFKVEAEDFFVEECLSFDLTGEGEHLFLKLEKKLLTTLSVQGLIARWANVPRKHVSYSGLKDKYAVTQQWFSVYLPGKENPSVDALEQMAEIKVLECSRHQKKLRIGAHKENYFSLTLREIENSNLLESNLHKVVNSGVPNYFGEQRFGHDRNNLNVANEVFLQKSKKLKRHQEGMYLSAVRSFIFNLMVSQRVANSTWDQYQSGDIVQLNGSHSCFFPEAWDDVLQARLQQYDIHLTAPLIGEDSWQEGEQENHRQFEEDVLKLHAEWTAYFKNKMKAVRRSMRVVPRDMTWQWLQDNTLKLNFYLPTGSFATAVLRELIQVDNAQGFQRL